MDDLVKQQIAKANAAKKANVPWEFDEPWKQPYYTYSNEQNNWIATTTSGQRASSSDISTLALYSWNIDFMLPHADSRMRAALRHLQTSHIEKQNEQTASVIFLQECLLSDVRLIASDAWVQRTFAITDLSGENWQSGYYGTVTLVDRRLAIDSVFRVHFSETRQERDGHFTDVKLGSQQKTLRLCNAHLESLALDPPRRPLQMQLIAQYMHASGIDGAVVSGDFNAIQDFDRNLHIENKLKDAYLELGGSEDDAEGGHTWGQQAATVMRDRFGTTRMDKAYFCGELTCLSFERFGAGIEVEDEAERKELVELGFDRPWVTDHLGVKTVFEISESGSAHKSSL